MILRALFFSFVAIVGTNQSHALDALPNASTFDSPGFFVFYSETCSEFAALSISTPKEYQGWLDDLKTQAKKSVEHLKAVCPAVQKIAVYTQVAEAPTLTRFFFTLSESTGWEPTKALPMESIKQHLADSGYGSAIGLNTAAEAYLRIKDGRFDALYGQYLENRLVATQFEYHRLTNTSGEYRIRGQIYDLGISSEIGVACESSREQYPMWGSFSLTVNSENDRMPMQIDWCETGAEKGKVINTALTDMQSYISQRDHPNSIAKQFFQTISQLDSLQTPADTNGTAAKQPLIDREFYRVYATAPDYCAQGEFDVRYRVNSEARDSIMSGDYIASIGNLVGNLVGRQCSQISSFTVHSSSIDEDDIWDSIRFRFNTSRGPNQPLTVVASLTQSDAAKEHDLWVEKNRLGPACDGPFCDLAGGKYLNAIYRGDSDMVTEIDTLYRGEAIALLNKLQSNLGLGTLPSIGTELANEQPNFLVEVARKYMHAYPVWGDSCFDPGAAEKTYSYTTPVVIETDEYGTNTYGGDTFEASYTVNPDFFSLRDKLASHKAPNRSDDPANVWIKTEVYSGILELFGSGACRTAEVKALENQLRLLTNETLENPRLKVPTANVLPAAPTRIETGPFSQTGNALAAIEWNTPLDLAYLLDGNITLAAPLTAEQRVRKMEEEAAALQARYNDELLALQQEMQQLMTKPQPGQNMGALMQEHSKKMQEAQQRFYTELQVIQMKYIN